MNIPLSKISENISNLPDAVDILVNEILSTLNQLKCIKITDYLPQNENSLLNTVTGNVTGQCSSTIEFLSSYYRNFLCQLSSILDCSPNLFIIASKYLNRLFKNDNLLFHCVYCWNEIDIDSDLSKCNCCSLMANIREIIAILIYISSKMYEDDYIPLSCIRDTIQIYHEEISINNLQQLEIDILQSIHFNIFISNESYDKWLNKSIKKYINIPINNPKCNSCQKYISEKVNNKLPIIPTKYSLI